MSETRFTPGPWSYMGFGNEAGTYIKSPETIIVCDLFKTFSGINIDYPNAEANAHLISASPDLYKALETLHKAVLKDMTYRKEPIEEDSKLYMAVTAALAKARGES